MNNLLGGNFLHAQPLCHISIILLATPLLGSTFRGSSYCRDVKKKKRLEWELQNKDDNFLDVICIGEAHNK